MEIVYKNTFIDRVFFQLSTISRSWVMRLLAAFYVLFICYSFLPDLWDPNTDMLHKAISFTLHIFKWIAGWLILGGILILLTLPRKDKGFLTEHKISLSETGFTEVTPVNRTEATWNGMFNLRDSDRYIYIYISKYAAHVIPKRAFASRAKSESFFQYALNQWQKAQSQNENE